MNRRTGVVLAGIGATLVIDAGGALFSRFTGFNYQWFAILSLILFCAIGVAAAHRGTAADAAIAGFIVALFSTTVGWWISWQIGPGAVEDMEPGWGPFLVFGAGMFNISTSVFLSGGAGVFWEKRRARAAAAPAGDPWAAP